MDIAFAVDDAYIEHLLVTLYSLLKHNQKHTVRVHVLSRDLSTTSKRRVNQVARYFDTPDVDFVNMVGVGKGLDKLPLTIDYIKSETYYRYALPDVLSGIDRVIYLDADILVTGDLAPLWETDLADCLIAGAKDYFIDNKDYKYTLGLADEDNYINAGVLLMDLEGFRKEGMSNQLVTATSKHTEVRYQDQDIINLVLQGRIKLLSEEWNFASYNMAYRTDKTGVILHYTGDEKPWDVSTRGPYDKLYDHYANECYGQLLKKDPRPTKYCLLTYSTENIGDDIQSVAARRFLPRVDGYADRDDITENRVVGASTVKLIMNGWFTHAPKKWPPKDSRLDPLLVSMFINANYDKSVKLSFLTAESRAFLGEYGPVGARDYVTRGFLEENNIENYFSGCLTLTLSKSDRVKKKDFILLVDVPDEVEEAVRRRTQRRVVSITNSVARRGMRPRDRVRLAELYLALYQSASCVVTTRLHAALPSLALETPILFIQRNQYERDRFAGLETLCWTATTQEYIDSYSVYDVDNPPENKRDYLPLRKSLEQRCRKYTGFDGKGFLREDLFVDINNLDMVENTLRAFSQAYQNQRLEDTLRGARLFAPGEDELEISRLQEARDKYLRISNTSAFKAAKKVRRVFRR